MSGDAGDPVCRLDRGWGFGPIVLSVISKEAVGWDPQIRFLGS